MPVMTTWPRYGVLAAAYAAERRRAAPHIPVVVGTGLVFATYAEALVQARTATPVEELVPVALRRWRKALGLSQRAAADLLDVSPGVVARAEARPGALKLCSLLSLLRVAGYELQLVERDGTPFTDDLRAEEILAWTAAGRRFSATREVVRLTSEPRWMAERGEGFVTQGPQWTSERRPGQYP